jgi:hypothetical protein
MLMTEAGSGGVQQEDQREQFLEACRSTEKASDYLRPHVTGLLARVASLRARWNAVEAAVQPYAASVPERTFSFNGREEDLSALETLHVPRAVSLDIFDTCLVRLLDSPEDVFRLLGEAAQPLTGMDGAAFAETRVEAENDLRKEGLESGEREDTSLEAIYGELKNRLRWAPGTSRKIMDMELELERLFLRPVESIRSLAWKWHTAGIQLFYTSEMYLSADDIKGLLRKAEFPVEGISVLTSGETGLSKGTGNLYGELLSIAGHNGILHVGDNPVTDGDVPRGRGLEACIIQTRKALYPDRFSNVLHAVATASIPFGNEQFWERFGYTVAGPLHFAFATHLYKTCLSQGKEHIHFLSRDGWFPRRVFRKLQQAWGHVAGDHYLYASREFLGLGSMTDITRDDWDFILKASPLLEVKDVFERLGIPASQYEPACRVHGLGDPKRSICHHKGYLDPLDHGRLYHAICQCLEPFNHYRSHVGQQLTDYLHDTGIYQARSMFVDVGWGGSSFKALAKLAPEGSDLHGAYFALLNEASPGTSAYFTASFRERRMEILLGSIALLEFLFGSPEPSVRFMDKGTGEWLPVFREPLPAYDRQAWTGMEKGIMEFTDRCLGLLGSVPESDGHPLVEDTLRNCIFDPTPDQLDKLGPLSHGEGWGTPHRLQMLPAFSESPDNRVIHEAFAYGPWKPGLVELLK